MGWPRSSVCTPLCESWALVSRRFIHVPALVALVCCAMALAWSWCGGAGVMVLAWCWCGGAGVAVLVWHWHDAVMALV